METSLLVPPEPGCPDGHTGLELSRLARTATQERLAMEAAKRNHLEAPPAQIEWLNRGGIGFHADPWLGNGDRWVLALCPAHVMKIERPDCHRQQTRKEISIWQTASPEFKSHLAPVLAYGLPAGLKPTSKRSPWLVMARCQMEPDRGLAKSFMDRIYGFGYIGLDNVGWYQGNLVILDYADPTQASFGVYPEPTPSSRTL